MVWTWVWCEKARSSLCLETSIPAQIVLCWSMLRPFLANASWCGDTAQATVRVEARKKSDDRATERSSRTQGATICRSLAVAASRPPLRFIVVSRRSRQDIPPKDTRVRLDAPFQLRRRFKHDRRSTSLQIELLRRDEIAITESIPASPSGPAHHFNECCNSGPAGHRSVKFIENASR